MAKLRSAKLVRSITGVCACPGCFTAFPYVDVNAHLRNFETDSPRTIEKRSVSAVLAWQRYARGRPFGKLIAINDNRLPWSHPSWTCSASGSV